MNTKAWIITEEEDYNAVVVFHKHGMAARRIGAQALDQEFDYVTCGRAKQYDVHAEKGWVPPSVLIGDGWQMGCWGCNDTVSEYGMDRDGNEWDLTAIIDVGPEKFYCSKGCKDAYEAEVNRINGLHQKSAAWMKERYPDLNLYEREGPCTSNKHPSYTCSLFLDYPGAKYGPARLCKQDVRKEDEKPMWFVATGDKEVFEAWMKDLAAA